ncbi:uncharacterized protein PHALS_04676 [Plasmopara halstedii]|uniref:Uncharacterized protein n=1 Tax=Plasmopara halstedii TaxID=4781 RepID=A0A0P1A9L4_PLAHL|nr:uncharacterized protein PHALS_04676 [Plasmopara halstedii]CEG37234.1 hypothetical protein PHALS_04676 [Plasmopara halstedii]|eukprot:XP_024573603.1 hypothetical protein PHALS_04676 [Plasmopara halstedii]
MIRKIERKVITDSHDRGERSCSHGDEGDAWMVNKYGRLDEDEKTLVAGKSVQISIEVLYMLSEVPTLISSRRPILLFRSFSLGVLEKSGTIEERTKLDPNHNAFVRLTRTSMG